MAQQYSPDYYSLNEVFYGRVNAVQHAQKAQASAPKDKTHKSNKKSSGLLSFARPQQSTSSYTEGKSTSCDTSEHTRSETSSICS